MLFRSIVATVEEKNGKGVLLFEGHEIQIPDYKTKVLKENGYLDKKVMMGIRPEDLYDPDLSLKPLTQKLHVTVSVYEMVGSEVFLYFDLLGTSLTARVDPKTKARVNDNISLLIDADKIHIFDLNTELKIVD